MGEEGHREDQQDADCDCVYDPQAGVFRCKIQVSERWINAHLVSGDGSYDDNPHLSWSLKSELKVKEVNSREALYLWIWLQFVQTKDSDNPTVARTERQIKIFPDSDFDMSDKHIQSTDPDFRVYSHNSSGSLYGDQVDQQPPEDAILASRLVVGDRPGNKPDVAPYGTDTNITAGVPYGSGVRLSFHPIEVVVERVA